MDFNLDAEYIEQANRIDDYVENFNLIMIEGVRGSGKTTLTNYLMETGKYAFYKTWGPDQRNLRAAHEKMGLELPQGTFFILDFISQIAPTIPIIADRGNMSGIAYQRKKFFDVMLQSYYVRLMREADSCILFVNGPPADIAARRVERKDDDEFDLYTKELDQVHKEVQEDHDLYIDAYRLMLRVGLEEGPHFPLKGSTVTPLYPRELSIDL